MCGGRNLSLMSVLCCLHQRMFEVEDVNCICIDWKKGSRCPYTQAANNIRVVGAEVAYFVNVLKVRVLQYNDSYLWIFLSPRSESLPITVVI